MPPDHELTDLDNAVTDIIPFLEFDELLESDSRPTAAFDCDLRVLAAAELDDTSAADDLISLELLWTEPAVEPTASPEGRHRHRRGRQARSGHRQMTLVGIGGGALAAATLAAVIPHGTPFEARASASRVTAPAPATTAPAAADAGGMQVVPAAPTADTGAHRQEFAVAMAFASERASREARMNRPLAMAPTRGIATSPFGARWGTLHGGIDVANAVGTPIYAAADGEVIAAGPTAGFGLWVKIKHADGTVTLYGHIDTTTVSVGDKVLAGDQIATMGNRGNSTGPHLHMEVHRNGSERIDPVAWLQAAGADVSPLGF